MDVASTLPPPTDDPAAQAKAVAQDVHSRRLAGELLPDEQVLADHPQLADFLGVELEQLTQPSSDARSTVTSPALATSVSPIADDTATGNPPPAAAASAAAAPAEKPPAASPTAGDLLATLDVPPPATAGAAKPSSPAWLGTAAGSSDTKAGGGSPPREVHPDGPLPVITDNRQTLMSVDDAAFNAETPYTPIYCPSVRPPMGVLRLFHDGEPTYTSYPILNDRFIIGRREGDLIIPHDGWVSGRHVEIQRRRVQSGFRWFLVDLNSLNGTFIRSEVVVLKHKDELFIGRERYRFVSDGKTTGILHVTKGTVSAEWIFGKPLERIGREPPCGMTSFAADPYLEPVHAEFTQGVDQTWTLRDKRSRNGVWLRTNEAELFVDSMFQIGEQRIGFWCPAAT